MLFCINLTLWSYFSFNSGQYWTRTNEDESQIDLQSIPFATSVTTRFAEAEGFKPPKPFSLPL